ncbi:MAG: DUF2752 domain-containing protein, partial [Micromonosporaceae bacterium]|nr:DUF2752 domain-containing protein [Micromonosporaceae bacterium]
MAQVTECPPVEPGSAPSDHDPNGRTDTSPVEDPDHGKHPLYVQYPAYAQPQDRVSRFGGFLERLWERPGWVAPLAILSCFAGLTGLFLYADPTDGRPDALGGCAVKILTGLDCPGCGGTRALWYLLQGNLPEAARHHMIAVFAAPFLVYMYLAWAGQRMFNWRLPHLRLQPRMVGIFLGAWGVFMVLRNLPWAPFTYFYV